MKLSKTEQDYVKRIYELEQTVDNKLVSLKDLTHQLAVSAPSVTEMVKRIEKKGLIQYHSYKGVILTEIGKKEALLILKAHRVWECFLLDVLNYQERDVHEEAEALEHAASARLIERLYAYLGKPAQCPHGQNIPQETFWYEEKQYLPLRDLTIGLRAELSDVPLTFSTYLRKLGLNETPRFVKIIEKLVDDTYIVEFYNGKNFVLPPFFQENVQVIVYQ